MRSLLKRFSDAILPTSAPAAAPLTAEQFTHHFINAATAAFDGGQFTIIKSLQVRCPNINGDYLNIFLANSYAQYTAAPTALETIIKEQLAALDALAEAQDERTILPVLKPTEYVATVQQQLAQAGHGEQPFPLVYKPINADLAVFLVFDSAAGMQMITHADLVELNMTQADLYSLAVQNLKAYVKSQTLKVERLAETGTAKVYVVTLDQTYEASLLLLDDLWNAPIVAVVGSIVAFVPARNVVVVTGADDAEGVRIAAHLANKWFSELSYSISPSGYVYHAGSWERYQP